MLLSLRAGHGSERDLLLSERLGLLLLGQELVVDDVGKHLELLVRHGEPLSQPLVVQLHQVLAELEQALELGLKNADNVDNAPFNR